MEPDKRTALEWISVLPMATVLAVVFSVATGIVSIVDTDKLSFEDYMNQIVVLWGGLAVGRGLAANKKVYGKPWVTLINSFPWATVVAIVVGIVGYIDVIANSNGSLNWEEYGKQMAVLFGALGIGRGVGVLKKDTVGVPVMEPEDDHIDLVEDDAGIEDPPLLAE